MKLFAGWLLFGLVVAGGLLVIAARAEVSCESRILAKAEALGERVIAIEEANSAPGSWIDGPEGEELVSIRVAYEALQDEVRVCFADGAA